MKKLVINFVLSVGLAGLVLWWIVSRMMAEVDTGELSAFEAIWATVSDTSPAAIALYGLSFLVVHVTRVFRWVIQVRPLGETDTRKVFRICAIGYAAIVAFPWRLGEAVRPYMLARESSKVTFAEALGTAVVERVVDGLLITGLLFVAVVTAPEPVSAVVLQAGYVSLAVFASASVGLVIFAWQRSLAHWLLGVTFGKLHSGLAQKLEGLLEGFVEGLQSLRSSGALLPFLGLTVIYWSANAFGIWWLANAFGLKVPLLAGFGLLAVLVVGIMVPAGIGFLGNFQYFLGEGLKLYLPAASLDVAGFAFALTMNLVQLVLQIGFAVPFLASSGIGVRGLVELQQQAQEGGKNADTDPVVQQENEAKVEEV